MIVRVALPIILADERLLYRLGQMRWGLYMDFVCVAVYLFLRTVGRKMKTHEDGRVQYRGGVLIVVAKQCFGMQLPSAGWQSCRWAALTRPAHKDHTLPHPPHQLTRRIPHSKMGSFSKMRREHAEWLSTSNAF